ncbi:hypothetical protein SCHPADRAFT_903526 [Schizopora paradoxa]|uniref:Uncharacterized protein n=1 Tax=Schizopora paradoxa TaxID=27342 RepID=A0A0H2SBD3_9AGAM|nr:hypothetical protein SCHPADRAFT_903526 [Schizopora paradoxa]
MALRAQLRPQHLVQRASCSFKRNARTLANQRSTEDDDEEEANALQLRRKASAPIASTWLNGEGQNFKWRTVGPNWLGKDVPFPLNPSFKPPPPLASRLKDRIYNLYMHNPKTYNIRHLSRTFGISLKRVDAVLRLKGLENSWDKQGKELQSGFRLGMESMLRTREDVPLDRTQSDVAADFQDDNEDNNRDRDRYQRHFWEPVVEGEQTVVAKALEKAREEAKAAHIQSRAAKSDPMLLGKVKKPFRSAMPVPKVVHGDARPGRPVISFTDVGGKFLDTKDRVRRMHEAERRKELRKGTRAHNP